MQGDYLMAQDVVPGLEILGDGDIPAGSLLDQFVSCPLVVSIAALVDLEEVEGRLVNVGAFAIAVREVVQHRPSVVFGPCAPGDGDSAAGWDFSGDVARYCASMTDDIGGMQVLDVALVSGVGGPGDQPRGYAGIGAVAGIFCAGDFDFSDVSMGCHCTGCA